MCVKMFVVFLRCVCSSTFPKQKKTKEKKTRRDQRINKMGNLFSSKNTIKSDLESLGGGDENNSTYTYSSSMTDQPINIIQQNTHRFDATDPEMKEYLKEHGYVVIKEILTKEEIEISINLLWEFLYEKCQMERNDPTTWTDENFSKIGDSRTGILGFSGINQSKFLWYLRLIPKVKLAFQNLFDTDDLLTSFDGGNIFRPWHNPQLSQYHSKTSQGWFHVDQGRKLLGFQCVQGLISLTDSNENTGGFCVIPNSHHHHTELMNSIARNNQNFVMIPSNTPILTSQQILPVCFAGDLILWDSRTIHCNTPALVSTPTYPIDQLLRIVGYVCMTPTSFAERSIDEGTTKEQILENRVRLYERKIGTSHWPHLLTTSISKDTTIPKSHDLNEESEELRCLVVGNEWGKSMKVEKTNQESENK